MADRITYVGLDVHKESIVVAVAFGGLRGEVREYGWIANTSAALDRLLRKLGGDGVSLRLCYEDGGHSGAPAPVPLVLKDPAARRCNVASTGGSAMYYIGIDVSAKESALCILDARGKIVRETKVPTDPEIIARFIADTGLAIERIGLESGCTAAWLFAGLQRHGWPVICIDARHAAAALQAGFRNKNDRNDARGIADLMRVNKYRPVWVKSPQSQREGRLLTARSTLQSQLVALENTIRGLLRQEGIGLTDRRTAFEAAVREVIADDLLLQAAVLPLLETRNAVLQHRATLDRRILRIVRVDPVCRLLMTAPGVGAIRVAGFQGRCRRSATVLAIA
jgi:transposase